MVNIPKIKVCNKPENTSKYPCKTGVTNDAKYPKALYNNAIIIPPLIILPNKRKDNEIKLPNSPITFIGVKNAIGSVNPFKYPPNPPDVLKAIICVIKNVIKAKEKVTL